MSNEFQHDVFFSYSREDAKKDKLIFDLAKRFRKDLEWSIWLDQENMNGQDSHIKETLRNAIKNSARLLLFVGSGTMDRPYVKFELNCAQAERCKVFLVLYALKDDEQKKDALVPVRYKNKYIYDFSKIDLINEYENLIEKLTDDLSKPVEYGRLPSKLKTLPPDYLPRYDYIVRMEDYLFGKSDGTINQTIGCFWGRSGIGKSVMANAFCRDSEIMSQCRDGIIWLNINKNCSFSSVLHQLRDEYPEIPDCSEEEEIKKTLRSFFEGKKTLVVLDNVWKSSGKIVDFFYQMFCGSNNKILVTTRNKEELSLKYRVNIVEIEQLSPDEAEEQMIRADEKGKLDGFAKEIIEITERHTLSISIVCAMRRGRGISWEGILERIKSQDDLINTIMPGYEYQCAFSAIGASVEELGDDTQYYQRLVVFSRNDEIPLNAAAVLWKSIDPSIDTMKAEDILLRLHNMSLLNYDEKAKKLSLHDLEFEFLSRKVENIDNLHKEFVDVFKQLTGGRWASYENDKYYYQHLIYHMLESKDYIDEAGSLLIDYSWIRKKLEICGCNAILEDYSYAQNHHFKNNKLIQMIGRSLFLSAAFLSVDYRQLPMHLVGRMLETEDPCIKIFLDQIKATESDFWLCPTARCMLPPDSNLLNQWTLDSRASVIACSKNIFVIATDEDKSVIGLFDLNQNESIYTWTHDYKILSMLIEDDTVIASNNAGEIVRWQEGEPTPERLRSFSDVIVYIGKLSSGRFVFVSENGTVYIENEPIVLSHSAPASTFRLVDDILYVGFTDGSMSQIDLNSGFEENQLISENMSIDKIAVNDSFIAIKATDYVGQSSKIIILDYYSKTPVREISQQEKETGGLHFISNDILLYSNRFFVYGYNVTSAQTQIVAITEHWVTNFTTIGHSIVCVDNYGHICCFDAIYNTYNSFNAYGSFVMRTMNNTECFGTLETGIRGVPVDYLDPENRSATAILNVSFCMAMTPLGIVYADEENGACFFKTGETQPIKAEHLEAKPLCAICFRDNPLIGYENGSIMAYNAANDGTFIGKEYYNLGSCINILCSDDESVFCASGKTIYKIGADKTVQSIALPEQITHIGTTHDYLFAVFGDNQKACYKTDDMRKIEILDAIQLPSTAEIKTSYALAGKIFILTIDEKIYCDIIGDYLLQFLQSTKQNLKDRKVFWNEREIFYCDNTLGDSFGLFTKRSGSNTSTRLQEINSAAYLSISSYDNYLFVGSQRDEISIWDLKTKQLCRTINTVSILKTLAVVDDHIAFVSGSHIFWLKIMNPQKIKKNHRLT